MAVAVKNTPDVNSASLLDRMAIASLAGAAYVLGTLGIVFYLLPSLWQSFHWGGNASLMVRGLAQLAALTGLLILGVRMLGAKTAPGLRAGIAVGLLGALLILLLTRWASLWIEYWSYDRGMFTASAGGIITAVVGLALLALGARFFVWPATERFLIQLEEQGWFHARAYKAMQGSRVRRGTIVGILFLIVPGIWLLWNGPLRRGPSAWQLNIPFTGQTAVESRGDVPDSAFAEVLNGRVPDWETSLKSNQLVLDRFTLQEVNRKVDPDRFVRIVEPGSTNFTTNQIVSKSEYDAAIKKLDPESDTKPQTASPQPATGPVHYSSLTLLPSIQFTIPLLLMAAGVWLAWRIVNVPAFADFLIATEAEMNKVSWTTQRRLIQDTIVVLVTVVLMAFYLFSMDVVWKSVLSWRYIGVLKVSSESTNNQAQPAEDRPY